MMLLENHSSTILPTRNSRKGCPYLHENVATINPLGRDEQNHDGTLSQIYNSIDFIDKETAAACYLNPANNKPKKRCHADLVFLLDVIPAKRLL